MMEHFYKNIQGFMNCEDLYKRMVQEAKDGAVFVELGVWCGRSAAYLAVEIANSGKKIDFYAVDHFKGSPELMDRPEIINGTLLQETTKRLWPARHYLTIVPMSSVEAAALFEDNSIDFIYIDGGHLYDDVKTDIQAWLPKVKVGGIISGDDYGQPIHPDVRTVVDEFFPSITREGNGGWVWVIKK